MISLLDKNLTYFLLYIQFDISIAVVCNLFVIKYQKIGINEYYYLLEGVEVDV